MKRSDFEIEMLSMGKPVKHAEFLREQPSLQKKSQDRETHLKCLHCQK
jgi:hypothetical protein